MDNSNYSQYEELGRRILKDGRLKVNRTGINTVGIIGHQMRFNLSKGEFPLITTKKVFTRGIFEELKWFINGETNIKTLTDKNVHIWDEWAAENGDCGPIYGEIWRRFPNGVPVNVLQNAMQSAVSTGSGVYDAIMQLVSDPSYKPIDQLQGLLNDLRTRPFSRRHLVSAWAPSVLPDETVSPKQNAANGRQALAACHTFFQLFVEEMSREEAIENRTANYDNVLKAIGFDILVIDSNLADLTKNESSVNEIDNLAKKQALNKKAEHLINLHKQVSVEFHNFKELISIDDYVGSWLPLKRLSMQLYQRSMDAPLGAPFNIASYAALLQLIALKTDMMPGDFIHVVGDAHVYVNQVELFKEQMERTPRQYPVLLITNTGNDTDWSGINDCEFEVLGYNPHPTVKYPPPAV
jgi:thymidylate synthase